ncbi:unnamed protein product [Musa acuminata var. zebrina]
MGNAHNILDLKVAVEPLNILFKGTPSFGCRHLLLRNSEVLQALRCLFPRVELQQLAPWFRGTQQGAITVTSTATTYNSKYTNGDYELLLLLF